MNNTSESSVFSLLSHFGTIASLFYIWACILGFLVLVRIFSMNDLAVVDYISISDLLLSSFRSIPIFFVVWVLGACYLVLMLFYSNMRLKEVILSIMVGQLIAAFMIGGNAGKMIFLDSHVNVVISNKIGEEQNIFSCYKHIISTEKIMLIGKLETKGSKIVSKQRYIIPRQKIEMIDVDPNGCEKAKKGN